jgi:hypothetical protein
MRTVKISTLCVTTALITTLITVVCGCAGNGDGLDENGRPQEQTDDTLQPTFASIQEHVFTPICTACHAGAAAPLGLRLDEGSSYALLVNAPSVEVPALHRVQPSDPDASYLIQKLEGIAAVGGRMPLNAPALPPATIAVVRQWIADGAVTSLAAVAAKSEQPLAQLAAIAPLDGEVLQLMPREIVVSANVELDTALLQSDLVTLRGSGNDGDFNNGNELPVAFDLVVRSQQPTILALMLRAAPLPSDEYELRISGSSPLAVADRNARAIDGDHDGIAGGDFVLGFTVEMPQ